MLHTISHACFWRLLLHVMSDSPFAAVDQLQQRVASINIVLDATTYVHETESASGHRTATHR